MQWNNHSREVPEGAHAPFGASSYHWTNYDEKKFKEVCISNMAKTEGTIKHDFAAHCITMRRKLTGKDVLARHVNDAIGYKMDAEVPLYYSEFFFGTTDAISFRNHPHPEPEKDSNYKYFLRIHDLKTGVTKPSLRQLEIYAALFFLEYNINPADTEIELRIYQKDNIMIGKPTEKNIRPIMDKIISFDKIAQKMKLEELSNV